MTASVVFNVGFAMVAYTDQYLTATGVGEGDSRFDHVGIETIFEFERFGYAKGQDVGYGFHGVSIIRQTRLRKRIKGKKSALATRRELAMACGDFI